MAVTTLAPKRPSAQAKSPLTPAYERLAGLLPGLGITEVGDGRLPAGDGWVGSAELAGGGSALDAFLAWDGEQVERDYGTRARPDVIASFGLHRYAWPATLLITVPWFLHRRVPRLPVDAVAFHRATGRLAVRTGSFACLPGDPAAARPGARVVPDEEALRAEVRDAVAEHLAPVLDGFRPRMRRGPRALWGVASDEITEGLWYVGQLLGEEERAVEEAGLLLPGSASPYPRGAGFRELTAPDGTRLATRDRASCCLFYTLRPQDTCVTCPRTCDAERVARLTSGA
ncbi:(2Fe-2S)-binding protein [Streptomyces sp. TRM 70351]|uniref:(2Fe-2S)-binding protein n=1 Tax=Streptomyces sp. TRM 70351 TaxID=3116552 RepID=UPI002E7C4EE9|nr:(2Fe-2S)-binding protein [Streptomyces sp. TRM 70351]MEE1926844.1 (2Fe-2S)-binding protein [Streptomyces sp. TRM 70351]